jgi:hypothetical protein
MVERVVLNALPETTAPLASDICVFADGLGSAVAHFRRLKVGLALPREFSTAD